MKSFCYALSIAIFAYSSPVMGAEAGMPQLNPEFWTAQIFWLIIIFSSLYLIIWKIFLPRITYIVENRKSKIVNDLDEAQKLKEKAEKKLTEYKAIIEKAKRDAVKIIEENRKKLELEINQKKQKINSEIENEVKKAEKEINDLKKTSISNIVNISAHTSTEIIKQIIDTEINKSSVDAIVNEVVKKRIEQYI
tara:strand:+ start:1070 stop:1648 length:579 start_codon:yes stop_codon:yes gene_type:complete